MVALHLGVVDIPYAQAVAAHNKKTQPGKPQQPRPAGLTTTGDVAEILEAKYGIMKFFFDEHKDYIIGEIENAMQGKLESLLMGAPATDDLLPAGVLSTIEDKFKQFLSLREMDGRVPGVPTQAAMRGVSHRMQHPYVRRGPRPSFIDTGLFSDSFKAWVD